MVSSLVIGAWILQQGLGESAGSVYTKHIEGSQREQQAATFKELEGTAGLEKHVPYMIPLRSLSFSQPVEAMKRLGDVPMAANSGDSDAISRLRVTYLGMHGPVRNWSPTKLEGSLPEKLAKISALREKAFENLTAEERKFAFERVDTTVRSFWPQFNYNDAGKAIIVEDQKLFAMADKVIWPALEEVVYQLSLLATPSSVAQISQSYSGKTKTVPGVTGELIGAEKTPHGWIIVGGDGDNVYAPTEPTAIIIDTNGNDIYRGDQIGNVSAEYGVSLICDRRGDDVYELAPFRLAAGRVGASVVWDHFGNDRYTSGVGGGGTGFLGIGLLYDSRGDDVYTGERFSLGSAMAGVGMLYDLEGADSYTADLFAMGVGGPLGAGALVDERGDDHLRLGFKHPSGYNGSDAPDGDPNHPNFQYEAWGMGMGIGRRVWPIPAWEEVAPYLAGGGVGVLYNGQGDDTYESSNFSLGSGYFFGAGAFADSYGNDTYRAARYGLGSGAHYAMGFFGEGRGNDTYTSTGPTYNCGCSWDRSLFWFFDFQGDDQYDLRRSAGPGRGDIGSWGLAVDVEGKDRYQLNAIPGSTSRNGLGAFFDLAGIDEYEGHSELGNRVSLKSGEAGLFRDLP